MTIYTGTQFAGNDLLVTSNDWVMVSSDDRQEGPDLLDVVAAIPDNNTDNDGVWEHLLYHPDDNLWRVEPDPEINLFDLFRFSPFTAILAELGNNNNNNLSIIPGPIISRYTLSLVGYTDAKADELWDIWMPWTASVPPPTNAIEAADQTESYFKFITCLFYYGPNCDPDQDDLAWQQCMASYGLSQEFQDTVLAPDSSLAASRHLKYCNHASVDVIRLRFEHLDRVWTTPVNMENELSGTASPPYLLD